MLNDEHIAEGKRRALEEDMQDPGSRRGWDRIEDLHRRANGYDAAVAERDALKSAISDVLCRMATTRAWAYRELSGDALSNVHRVIDHLWGVLDPDRSIHPALAILESPEDAPTETPKPDWRERARARVGDQVAARMAELMAEPPPSAEEFDEAMRRNKAEAEAHLDRQSRGISETTPDAPTGGED